jgi:phosphatidylserine decarboxylase
VTLRTQIRRVLEQEDLNFLLTNRVPRRLLTEFMGWFSKVEQPVIRDLSIGLWRFFSGLDLSEAKERHFRSMHDCFIRELKDGMRPIDRRPDIVVSPCDAIVGACGAISGTTVCQVKGFPYTLEDLLGNAALVDLHRDGVYATLRLSSSMYHRFHAPHDCRIDRVVYISGDTWNVNPIALRRIEKLFCKNERCVLQTRLAATGQPLTLVPVAAVLVACIRLHFLDVKLGLDHRGANVFPCGVDLEKGEEMGWFEHGSTIIVFAPQGFSLWDGVREGVQIRVGRPLMRVGS